MESNGIVSKFKSAISDSPSKKLMIFVGIAMAGAVGYAMVPRDPPKPAHSTVAGIPRGNDTVQGGTPLTPEYTKNLSSADKTRIEEARQQGGTAMPTVRVQPQTSERPVLLPEAIKEPPQPPVVDTPKPPVIEQVPVVTPAQVQQVPIVAPVQQMQSPQDIQKLGDVLNHIVRRPNAVADVQFMYDQKNRELAAAAAATTPQSAPVVSGNQTKAQKIKVPLAGTILYANLVGRANSDAPGPVVAKILQGQYAGATLVGAFTTGRDALIIKFTKMTVGTTPDGEEINETVNIDAVAVDTKHIGTPLATSVDRHLMEKIGIGLGASFAQGFGQAVAQTNNSSVLRPDGSYTTTTTGLDTKNQLLSAGGHALSSAGNILMDEFGRRPTTIIVDSGTPIGILFI
jgi:intracellular multiplication protein IcmE